MNTNVLYNLFAYWIRSVVYISFSFLIKREKFYKVHLDFLVFTLLRRLFFGAWLTTWIDFASDFSSFILKSTQPSFSIVCKARERKFWWDYGTSAQEIGVKGHETRKTYNQVFAISIFHLNGIISFFFAGFFLLYCLFESFMNFLCEMEDCKNSISRRKIDRPKLNPLTMWRFRSPTTRNFFWQVGSEHM